MLVKRPEEQAAFFLHEFFIVELTKGIEITVTVELQPHSSTALPGLPTIVSELKAKRQGNGNNNTINGNGNTQSNGNGNVSNSSNSHGLSQSDKIAVGVGVGGGVVAIIGVILTYLQLKHSKAKKAQLRQAASATPPLQQSQRFGSSWPAPHSFSAYRNELPAQ
jgi:hypothetical protein